MKLGVAGHSKIWNKTLAELNDKNKSFKEIRKDPTEYARLEE